MIQEIRAMNVTDPRWAEFGIGVISPSRSEPDIYTVNFRQRSKQKSGRRPGESTQTINPPDVKVQVKVTEGNVASAKFEQPGGHIAGFERADFEQKALEQVAKELEQIEGAKEIEDAATEDDKQRRDANIRQANLRGWQHQAGIGWIDQNGVVRLDDTGQEL